MYSFKEHYSEIESRRLRVKYKDGSMLEGEFAGVYSGLETQAGQMLLELDTGEPGIIRGAYEDEIEDIEILSDKHGEWI